jgi:hypothetical protein
VLKGGGVTILSRLDVLEEVKLGQLAFVPLRNKLLRPLTLALCTAPSRQLSRPAQMAIQKLTAVMEEMQAGTAASPVCDPPGLKYLRPASPVALR